MKNHVLAPFLFALALATTPAIAQSDCGLAEKINPGESVAALADRCGVAVEALLRANKVDNTDNLRALDAIIIPEDDEKTGSGAAAATEEEPAQTGGWLDRARKAVQDAGRRVDEAATEAGRSASEYLSSQPDLNRDILEFGEKLGLPGVTASSRGSANLEVTAAANGKIAITATGLPSGAEVNIGLRHDDGIEVIATATVAENGGVTAQIETPKALEPGKAAVFVVETRDERMRLASEPYTPN